MAKNQAYGTKIANSRFGGMRFGNREHKEPLNSEVTTYTLSEEELKQVREGKPLGAKSKGDLERAKKLLANSDKDIEEIAKETGTNKGTIRTYAGKIRGTTKSIKKDEPQMIDKEKLRVAAEKIIKKENERLDKNVDFQKEIDKLERDLNEAMKTNQEIEAQMDQLEKKYRDMEFENQQLDKDYEKLKDTYDILQDDYNKLKLEQHELNNTDRLQIRITQLEAEVDILRRTKREDENLIEKLSDRLKIYREALKVSL